LERRILAAIFSRDKTVMAKLMHPDGYGLDASVGLVSQPELVDGIELLAPESGFRADEFRVVRAGDGIAAVTYRLRQWGGFTAGRFRDVPYPEVVYCSSVWRHGTHGWQAVFHHETPARSAGRDEARG